VPAIDFALIPGRHLGNKLRWQTGYSRCGRASGVTAPALGAQPFTKYLIDYPGVSFTVHRLHHLADEKAEELIPA
jgi:hypothetical protein